MESLVSTFHIDLKIIIAQLVNFGVVFAVLYLFAIRPLMKVMTSRTSTIEKGLSDAKQSAAKLEKAEKEYAEMLLKARQESQDIIKNAREEADKKKSQIITEAKEEVARVVTQGKNQLAQEKLTMIGEAKAEVVMLATEGIKKILGEAMLKEMDAEVIKKSFKEE